MSTGFFAPEVRHSVQVRKPVKVWSSGALGGNVSLSSSLARVRHSHVVTVSTAPHRNRQGGPSPVSIGSCYMDFGCFQAGPVKFTGQGKGRVHKHWAVMQHTHFRIIVNHFPFGYTSCNGPPGTCLIKCLKGPPDVEPQLGVLRLNPMILP
jgi:hypothetical protein